MVIRMVLSDFFMPTSSFLEKSWLKITTAPVRKPLVTVSIRKITGIEAVMEPYATAPSVLPMTIASAQL